VELNQPHQPTAQELVAIVNAARHIPEQTRYTLSREQARTWLTRVIEKEKAIATTPADGLRFSPDEQERFLDWAGTALAAAILPTLAPDDLSDEMTEHLLGTAAPSIAVALPAMVALRPELHDAAADRLRHLLAGAEETWGYTAQAILEWSTLENAGTPVPVDLISEIAGAVQARNRVTLRAALAAATTLAAQQRFSTADRAHLDIGLTYLFAELDYEGERAKEFDDLSLLRARCVTLAAALRASGHNTKIVTEWLAAAESDPLPDVRCATTTHD
jgi:hypothetical protein